MATGEHCADEILDRPLSDAVARHCRPFWTRQAHDTHGFVRTFGTVVQVGFGPLLFAGIEALRLSQPNPPLNCAHGKVVAFSRNKAWGEAGCYQVSASGTQAQLVACCNATAAAAAVYADVIGTRHARMRLELPGAHFVWVDAELSAGPGGAGRTVRQTWSRVPFVVREVTVVDGRRCCLSAGALNDYLIIQVEDGTAAEFPVDEALQISRGLGFRQPLLSRIAVVEASGGRPLRARFFTCGERRHPSAPPTGLAVLALAARSVTWLAAGATRGVETGGGRMALPHVEVFADDTATVSFPPLIVDLGEEMAR